MIHLLVLKWSHHDSDFELIVHCDTNFGSMASLIISFCLCQIVWHCCTYLHKLKNTFKRSACIFSNVAYRSFDIPMETLQWLRPCMGEAGRCLDRDSLWTVSDLRCSNSSTFRGIKCNGKCQLWNQNKSRFQCQLCHPRACGLAEYTANTQSSTSIGKTSIDGDVCFHC